MGVEAVGSEVVEDDIVLDLFWNIEYEMDEMVEMQLCSLKFLLAHNIMIIISHHSVALA